MSEQYVVEVLREGQGWAVKSGERRLRHFGGEDQFETLGEACEWTSQYAAALGATAWLLSSGRRTRLTVANSARLWQASS